VTYPGGKNGSGTYQKLINLMPPHGRYFEPFLGGGAILRLKRPALVNVGMDLERSQLSVVSAELAARGGTVTIGELSGSCSITGDDVAGRRSSPELACGSYRLFRGCAIAMLESSRFTAHDLVYCDPPYLMETRRGCRLYQHEMTDVHHRRFLRAALALPAMVMISGYWSPLYAAMLATWNTITFESTALHDYRYLGADFRERERIKRKTKRWTERLQRMPALERQALLAAVAATARRDDAS
jgi:hypothetical protein